MEPVDIINGKYIELSECCQQVLSKCEDEVDFLLGQALKSCQLFLRICQKYKEKFLDAFLLTISCLEETKKSLKFPVPDWIRLTSPIILGSRKFDFTQKNSSDILKFNRDLITFEGKISHFEKSITSLDKPLLDKVKELVRELKIVHTISLTQLNTCFDNLQGVLQKATLAFNYVKSQSFIEQTSGKDELMCSLDADCTDLDIIFSDIIFSPIDATSVTDLQKMLNGTPNDNVADDNTVTKESCTLSDFDPLKPSKLSTTFNDTNDNRISCDNRQISSNVTHDVDNLKFVKGDSKNKNFSDDLKHIFGDNVIRDLDSVVSSQKDNKDNSFNKMTMQSPQNNTMSNVINNNSKSTAAEKAEIFNFPSSSKNQLSSENFTPSSTVMTSKIPKLDGYIETNPSISSRPFHSAPFPILAGSLPMLPISSYENYTQFNHNNISSSFFSPTNRIDDSRYLLAAAAINQMTYQNMLASQAALMMPSSGVYQNILLPSGILASPYFPVPSSSHDQKSSPPNQPFQKPTPKPIDSQLPKSLSSPDLEAVDDQIPFPPQNTTSGGDILRDRKIITQSDQHNIPLYTNDNTQTNCDSSGYPSRSRSRRIFRSHHHSGGVNNYDPSVMKQEDLIRHRLLQRQCENNVDVATPMSQNDTYNSVDDDDITPDDSASQVACALEKISFENRNHPTTTSHSKTHTTITSAGNIYHPSTHRCHVERGMNDDGCNYSNDNSPIVGEETVVDDDITPDDSASQVVLAVDNSHLKIDDRKLPVEITGSSEFKMNYFLNSLTNAASPISPGCTTSPKPKNSSHRLRGKSESPPSVIATSEHQKIIDGLIARTHHHSAENGGEDSGNGSSQNTSSDTSLNNLSGDTTVKIPLSVSSGSNKTTDMFGLLFGQSFAKNFDTINLPINRCRTIRLNKRNGFEFQPIHGLSPTFFHIQIDDDVHESLLKKIEEYRVHAANRRNIPDSSLIDWRNKEFCFAAYGDEPFNRAQIFGIKKDKDNILQFDIHYIDFGNREIVPLSRIRPMPEVFKKFPRMAVWCSLNRIKPKPRTEPQFASRDIREGVTHLTHYGEKSDKLIDGWPKEVAHKNFGPMINPDAVGTLYGIPARSQNPTEVLNGKKQLRLQVIAKTPTGDLNYADDLVSRGFADYID